MSKLYCLSGRQLQIAHKSGIDILIPWPEEILGVWGSNTLPAAPVADAAACDQAMDRYINDVLDVASLRITSCVASRCRRQSVETPCIVVRLYPAPYGDGCRVGRTEWIDGIGCK